MIRTKYIIRKLYHLSVFSPLFLILACLVFAYINSLITGFLGAPPRGDENIFVAGLYIISISVILLFYGFCLLVSPYIIAGYIWFSAQTAKTESGSITAKGIAVFFLLVFAACILLPISSEPDNEAYNLNDYRLSVTIACLIVAGINLIGLGISVFAYFRFCREELNLRTGTRIFHLVFFFLLYLPLYALGFVILVEIIYAPMGNSIHLVD